MALRMAKEHNLDAEYTASRYIQALRRCIMDVDLLKTYT